MASRGRLHWLQKTVQLYVSLWENDPTSHLIYYLSKQFPSEFKVCIASIKCSSIASCSFRGHVCIEIDDKRGYSLGHGYLKFDYLWFKKKKDGDDKWVTWRWDFNWPNHNGPHLSILRENSSVQIWAQNWSYDRTLVRFMKHSYLTNSSVRMIGSW